MASFQRNPEEWESLDWRLLLNGAISLYFDQDVLSEDIAWFKQNGYQIYHFDCSQWTSEKAFHLDLKRTLSLPDYYNKNLDALNDSLIDIDVPTTSGCILQFMRFDLFAEQMPSVAQAMLDIIEGTSRRFLLTGQRLIAMVQSNDPRISFQPVGACPVMWNPKEWQNSKRGI
ncbi:MAG: barstar family protein [Ardenticatenaceae bacterium]|nr:barstar family protein [Ardenticatenaceae bacterium]